MQVLSKFQEIMNSPRKTLLRFASNKVVLFILATFFTAIITIQIQNYFNRQEIEIEVWHLALEVEPQRHVYLITAYNYSNVGMSDLDLTVYSPGYVYASTFDGNNTTHKEINPSQERKYLSQDKNYKLKQSVHLLSSSSSTPLNTRSDIASSSTFELSNQVTPKENNNNLRTRSKYNVSLNPFSLASGERVSGSLVVNQKLSEKDFKCGINANIVQHEFDQQLFQRLQAAIGGSSYLETGKIFVDGYGYANDSMTRSSRLMLARERAFADLIKEVTQRLYGVWVTFQDSISRSSKSVDDKTSATHDFRSIMQMVTEGKIDKDSLVVYDEKCRTLEDGSAVCTFLGYYQIPWRGGDEPVEPYTALPIAPKTLNALVREGNTPPTWVKSGTKALSEESNAIFAVGVSSAQLPKPIGMRMAAQMAKADLASTLQSKVSSMVKTYSSDTESGEELSIEEMTNISTNIVLRRATIREYYFDGNTVYALAELLKPSKDFADLSSGLSEEVRDMIIRNADKAFEELEAALDE